KTHLNKIYGKIIGSTAYLKNSKALDFASYALTTLSAIATAYVNAMVHAEVIGTPAAIGLAVLILCIVEGTLLIANHGLLNVYTNNRQRFWASVAYWVIKVAMWLNIAIICLKLGHYPLPGWLESWNKWSVAVHAAIGLILLDLIRNNDATKQHKIAELRAQTAAQDALTTRRLNAFTSFILLASALRGKWDGAVAAWNILRLPSEWSTRFAERMQNLINRDAQNLSDGAQNLLLNHPPDPLKNVTPAARLANPVPVAPLVKGSAQTRKLGSGGGYDLAKLPTLPNIVYEPHPKGGVEVWFCPNGKKHRANRTYLAYLGKRELIRWENAGTLDEEVSRKVLQEQAAKNL
ncbi:MAG TPA: hypothetical protein VJ302_29200, partial [Blastocatellia bacterium]|nr:hypothetical protein [Blastocatellia bacterium]